MKLSLGVVVVLAYFGIKHGDEYLARYRMNELCAKNDVLVIDKTIALPTTYWDADGSPNFFDSGNRLQDDIEGVRYQENSEYRNLDYPKGVQEVTVEFVNATTGEVYATGKEYGYFGGWHLRSISSSPQIQYRCGWDAVGKEKYNRLPVSHRGRLASWVFVPRESGLE